MYPVIVKQEEEQWQVHYNKLSNDLAIGGSRKSKQTKVTATATAAKAGSNNAPDTSKSSPKTQRRTKVEGPWSTSDSSDPTATGIDQSNSTTSCKQIDHSLAKPV